MTRAEAAVPLARLFAMAFRHLIDELHERLDERGWPDHRPAFGFVLLAAREQPLTGRAIGDLLGMTKQAASKLVESMEDAGYVRRRPDPSDARVKVVALTPRGHRLLDVVEEVYAELETDWSQVIGVERLEAMRSDLLDVLRARHGGDLPAVRPTW
ncbi:MAG TPA: MarR family transcriptional regulator [Acidimicrobiales bacterium]|jgi:DNA-binding MarR family transcriptional regulator